MGIAKLSVLMPYRNAASTLSRAIESILQQSFTDFELILVDDGSTDSSKEISCQYEDKRIRNVSIPESGIVAALNKGLAISQGKYIARMDADDYSYPERLKLQYEFLDRNPDIGIVSGKVSFKGNREKDKGYALYVDWINQQISPEQIYLNRFVESPIAHPSVMIRKMLLDRFGSYREGDFPEDYELWLRMMDQDVRFSKIDGIILDWYDEETRLSRIHKRYSVEAFYRIKTKYFTKWFMNRFQQKLPPLLIWGTGKSVLQKSKYLDEYGLTISGYIDVVSKPDKKIRNKPVFYYKNIPENVFILSYVSDRVGRLEIHEYLIKKGYKEGKDFYLMA